MNSGMYGGGEMDGLWVEEEGLTKGQMYGGRNRRMDGLRDGRRLRERWVDGWRDMRR